MSGEVEIRCLGDSAHIADLGLKMVRGARVYTNFSTTSRSRDLELAKAQGLVAVRVMRAMTIKTDDNGVSAQPRLESGGDTNLRMINRAAYQPGTTTQVAATPVDMAPLELTLRDLITEVRHLREDIQRMAVTSGGVDPMLLADAIKSALSGITFNTGNGKSGQPASLVSADEERFIPSGIVSLGAKADISPRVTNEGAVSLDDAQTALREARRRVRENQ